MKRSSLAAVALLWSLAACGPDRSASSTQGTSPVADLLVTNGRVFTADESGTVAEAVAVAGSTILRVGSSADLADLRGPGTRVIDAQGATVAPGFNDSHVHFLSGGFSLGQVDLAGLTTLPEVQEAIRAFAAAHPGTGWLQGFGWLYAPFPGGSPTRAQLDQVVPDRPAVMDCYDGHSVWVNSRALEAAGITRDTPDPPNGQIVKDPRSGEPTGHLKEAAADLVTRTMPRPGEADQRAALEAAVAHASSVGVTSIQNAGGAQDQLPLYEGLRQTGGLHVRAYLAFSATADTTEADVEGWEEARRRLGDDPTVKVGIVKIFADGVIESRTAAMLEPYEGSNSAGALNLSPDALTRLVTMLDRRAWQIEIHAIGDKAIRASLDAFEHASSVNPAPPRGRRHRLEHIEAIAEADIPRFGRLGVIASQQPMHVPLGDMNQEHPSGPWPDNIGPERFARAWAWQRIRAAGGRLTFGSDWPVAPLAPGQGIWLVATRVSQPGGVAQAMPVADAIRGYTVWPAYASFEESRKGTIAPGMLADLVILTTDVLARPPTGPNDIVVATTIVDGRVVYQRGEGQR